MSDTRDPTSSGTIDLRTPPGSQGGSAAPGSDDVFAKFDIPQSVRQKYPDLIPLILATESMNDDERQYWFQILPIMTDEQVNKLRDILLNEKKQLQKLDKEYEQEVKRINGKHVSQWKAFEAKEKRDKLHAAEKSEEGSEQEQEEDLLKKLKGL